MPRPRKEVPTYRLHKQSGQAIVTVNLNGTRKDILLGKYNSPESKEEYARILAQLRTPNGAQVVAVGGGVPDLTINELMLAYTRWAEGYYKTADGKPNRSGTAPRFALRTVRRLFGPTPAAEFGPKALKAVREEWVREGLSRKVINGRVGAVRRMFKWAVSEELIPVEVQQRLAAVEGLRAGRTTAHDNPPVRPAVWADVEKALPHMPAGVAALVRIQVQSGVRAGELLRLRVGDIDRTDPDMWVYQPAAHKGTWKGRGRVVYFGKRSQAILAPLLEASGGPEAFVFSPARSEAERNARRGEDRVTPRYPSHMKRNERKRVGAARRRPPGERYTTTTYRRAIERACERAEVPTFTPHRLRHLAGTRVREEFGVDVARALLGHSLAAVTEIYSREVDRQLAMKAVEQFG